MKKYDQKVGHKIIEKYLLLYGFLPLLLVLKVLELEERYEWCDAILEVLGKHSKKYNFNIPKRYSIEAVIQMKINFMAYHGLSGDTAEGNNYRYASDILIAINNAYRLQRVPS